MLVFRNDGLKRRELFLLSVHFTLQFNSALLIHAQIGNFALEGLQLSFRSLKIGAHALIRKSRDPKANDYDDHRKAEIKNGLQRQWPISEWPRGAGTAGVAGALAPCTVCGLAISAVIEKANVVTDFTMSFSLASLISTLSKYPERFIWVRKLATAFTELASPSIVRVFPVLDMFVSHRPSVCATVLATF